MKKLFILLCFMSISIHSIAQYFPIDTLHLNNSYRELQKDFNSLKKQQDFLKAFPSTYTEMIMTYQYVPDPNYDLTMYHKTSNHFYHGLGKLHLIQDSIYCDKLINLSLGGRKDYDGGAGFKLQWIIGEYLIENLEVMLDRLHKKTYVEQFSFWYFFFLNTSSFMHAKKFNYTNLKRIMHKYDSDLKLIEAAYNASYDKDLKLIHTYPYPYLYRKMLGEDSSLFRENRDKEDARKTGIDYADNRCDMIVIDKKIFFIKQTPISHFKGYTNLFNDYNVIKLAGFKGIGDKGYSIKWVVKNNLLFIKDIELSLPVSSSNPHIKIISDVSDAEIKKRIEEFTGEKFNKEGLLPATWVNEELGVLSIHPKDYKKMFERIGNTSHHRNNQEHYGIKFKDGKYIGIKLIKGKTIE